MSSFDPEKHDYILIKITCENYEKYCTDVHVPLENHLAFDPFDGAYLHVDAVEDCDYVCSSAEEFDQLIFLHYLEN